ncbi:MAG: FGGY family carbohydrate kinase, partial [Gaiellaceae bacterium]
MILAIDQGTTGTTCLVVDEALEVAGRAYRELPQHFPRPGWVEADPEEIWQSVLAAAAAALEHAGARAADLDAIGITNQRETTLLWDRASGRAVGRAIVWQDRRTAERCRELDPGLIREHTGLVPDPYFSATKLEWLLREHGTSKGLAFGTVDSWLVWKLTGGDAHVTDRTNASRTLLANLRTLDWDDELLAVFGVDRSLLPRIAGSSETVGEAELLGARVPVSGIAGDQQAALFGQGCHEPGQAKATYGTGTFLLVHTGADAVSPPHGLLATAAADGYALEGAVLVSGAAIQWLRDGLRLFERAADSEAFAARSNPDEPVVFVPGLVGLGAPHWVPEARGVMFGLTRATTAADLARAALEGVAFQVADLIDAADNDLGAAGAAPLKVDGGMARNDRFLRTQADFLGRPVVRAAEAESTALGAGMLAAVGAGLTDEAALRARTAAGTRFDPTLGAA